MKTRAFFHLGLFFIIILCVNAITLFYTCHASEPEFKLMEGSHVDLYFPMENHGINFTEVLTENQAVQTCDAGYEILQKVTGFVPYSGQKITITAEGYEGEDNKPSYAGLGGNPIVIVYDLRSKKNYILSYTGTSESDEYSVPNWVLYFHEMWHDFTPRAFIEYFCDHTYIEGFARFMSNWIKMMIILEAEKYNLTDATINGMEKNTEWSTNLEEWLKPSSPDWTSRRDLVLSAFLLEIWEKFGADIFPEFFSVLNQTGGLFSIRSETDRNSIFIALLCWVSGNDLRSEYKKYGFFLDESLYENITIQLISHVTDKKPPVASAGHDLTVDEDTVVMLNGSASWDNAGIVSYVWTFIDITPQTIGGVTTAHAFQNPGIFTVTLNVTDAVGNWATDEVVISVLNITLPVVDAGEDKTVIESSIVTFDGSASSDNAEIESYTWTFTDKTRQTLSGANPKYTFTNPGVYTVILNVTDSRGNYASDSLMITVLDVTNPIAEAGPDRIVKVGENVIFDATSSTDNVGIVSYEWDFGEETIEKFPIITRDYKEPGTYTVTLLVKDRAGNSATDSINITVEEEATEPIEEKKGFQSWIFARGGWVIVLILVAFFLGMIPYLIVKLSK